MQNKNQYSNQTRKEEIINAISHGTGVLLSIAGLVLLLVYASMQGDIWKIISFSIYGASLIILYLISTLYHLLKTDKLKKLFQILDHSSIYLLIAGTYTPILLINLKGVLGWTYFGIVWGLAIIGILLKSHFINKSELLTVIIYILMGWIIIFALKPLITSISFSGFLWLLAGGISYTAGVVFFLWESLPFQHFIWHLFVMGGSICHFFLIFNYVLPA